MTDKIHITVQIAEASAIYSGGRGDMLPSMRVISRRRCRVSTGYRPLRCSCTVPSGSRNSSATCCHVQPCISRHAVRASGYSRGSASQSGIMGARPAVFRSWGSLEPREYLGTVRPIDSDARNSCMAVMGPFGKAPPFDVVFVTFERLLSGCHVLGRDTQINCLIGKTARGNFEVTDGAAIGMVGHGSSLHALGGSRDHGVRQLFELVSDGLATIVTEIGGGAVNVRLVNALFAAGVAANDGPVHHAIRKNHATIEVAEADLDLIGAAILFDDLCCPQSVEEVGIMLAFPSFIGHFSIQAPDLREAPVSIAADPLYIRVDYPYCKHDRHEDATIFDIREWQKGQ